MKRQFQVAATGSSIGLFLASSEVRSLSVVVHPKFWQPRPTQRKIVWPDDQTHLAIAAGEMDFVEIEGSPEHLSLLDSPVSRFGPSGDSLITYLPSQAAQPLLEESPRTPDPHESLMGIEALMRRTGIGSLLPVDIGFESPQLRNPLLRPLLYQQFVNEVEAMMARARREYVWRDETLTIIRGRPDAAGLTVSAETGWPSVSCRFQDFNRETPTLMAICAALNCICEDGTFEGAPFAELSEVRDRAIRLRRLLADVPELNRSRALVAARDAQRSRTSGLWSHAVEMAVGILLPTGGLSLGSHSQAIEIVVDSSRIWELLILAVLRKRELVVFDGNASSDTPLKMERPWLHLGTRPPTPDLLVGDGPDWSIMDAKYKDLRSTPAIEDLYQMFAYSHLGRINGTSPVTSLGLVYPVRADIDIDIGGPFLRGNDSSAALEVRKIRFPSVEECINQWASYLASQSMIFQPLRHMPPSLTTTAS